VVWCMAVCLASSVMAQHLWWLGTLGGNRSWAYAVSADGSVVVGWAEDARGRWRAFRWTASRGMEDLNEVYADILEVHADILAKLLGGDSSVELFDAYGITPDGRYIVGRGIVGLGQRSLTIGFLLDTGGRGVTR